MSSVTEMVDPSQRGPAARGRHRLHQFLRAATARIDEEERRRAAELLGPRLYPLFQSMRRNDQRHALDVTVTLRRMGETDPVVLQSALLHDVGKAEAPFSIIERSAAVFLRAAGPAVFQALCRRLPPFGRRYHRYRDHAQLGAELVRQAGGDPLVAQVIAEHHRGGAILAQTQRLRAADGMN